MRTAPSPTSTPRRSSIDGKGGSEEYPLHKFMRSNQGTLIHQKPIIDVGADVAAGDVLADGSATDSG